jgi:hypothetical protein
MMTPDRFKQIYPQFAEVADEKIERCLGDFYAMEKMWVPEPFVIDEDLTDSCAGLYGAHKLTLELSFPITKDNIDQALTRGKIIKDEKAPDFTVSYESYNGGDDYKVAALHNSKEREASLLYLREITKKYFDFFDIQIAIPCLTGPYFVQFLHTMYGEQLLYNLSLIENFIWEQMKKNLQAEISEKIRDLRDRTPAAVLV